MFDTDPSSRMIFSFFFVKLQLRNYDGFDIN